MMRVKIVAIGRPIVRCAPVTEFVELEPEVVSDRILTIPNVITFVRLLCLPVFLWLLLHDQNRAAAAWLLGALGATDFADGYIARHFNQTSALGKVIDPVADRLLLFAGIGAILYDGSVPVWFAIVVLTREVLISIATLVLAALGARRIDVTWYGKAGTFANMFAFPLFLGSHSTVSYDAVCGFLAWIFLVPGLVLSYFALLLYIPLARAALAEGRAAESGVASGP
jgi:cardiolipin synthase